MIVPPQIAAVLLPLIVAASLVLMLLRPRGIAEVYWVGGGALLLIALRLVPLRLAGHAVAEGTGVYLFLAGMMMLAALASREGVFDWLASVAVKHADGSCSRFFTMVFGVAIVVTVFLSNDATAVVLTPAILTAVRKTKVTPLPYLFVCALVANAASFVLPISDPANLVVFRGGMPPLGRWLADFGVPSILSIAATYLAMRWIFRKPLREAIAADSPATRGSESGALGRSGKLVLGGLGLTAVVLLTASALHTELGLPTFAAAVAVAVAVSVRTKSNPLHLVKDISWQTLLLVAGLFVMVDAVESQGALRLAESLLAEAQRLGPMAGALAAGFAVGLANNVANNLPVALTAGSTLHAAHATGLLAKAVLIGVDLGPNLSVPGSLATILWLQALRKEGISMSHRGFLKVGAIAMPVALLAALGAAIAMQAILHAAP